MSTFQFRGKIGNWKRKSNKHLTKLKKREKKNKDLHAEGNNLWLILFPEKRQ